MTTIAKSLLSQYQDKDFEKLRDACDIVSIKVTRSVDSGMYEFADGSAIEFVGSKFTERR